MPSACPTAVSRPGETDLWPSASSALTYASVHYKKRLLFFCFQDLRLVFGSLGISCGFFVPQLLFLCFYQVWWSVSFDWSTQSVCGECFDTCVESQHLIDVFCVLFAPCSFSHSLGYFYYSSFPALLVWHSHSLLYIWEAFSVRSSLSCFLSFFNLSGLYSGCFLPYFSVYWISLSLSLHSA